MNKKFTFFFVAMISIMVILVTLKASIIFRAKNSGKTIYQIEVNSFNRLESYTTTDYVRDEKSGCITFKDEFGIKHIVCNNYTIAEY